ncbi:PAS domain S-box-containing protein [Cohaesibacter marisflavi]|uniref:Blue-light-activated histidine kinase n=1 Tax=Cohaesibacter marisflavi TaxID=655353 RepID=A0A1I5ETV2_9HYPH|nr:sensor histidine kinase [Cohaesibacter marisflavi]SFO14813.1 PAS domain S-box-containing protein [Cohaesibacter marisflavi]
MIDLNFMHKELLALVQDEGRLKAVEQICGLGILPDSDFNTLIDMIRAQTGADTAFIAVVKNGEVLYQACSCDETPRTDVTDAVSISCLIERDHWSLSPLPPVLKQRDYHGRVWGIPIMVSDHAIGSLCLMDATDRTAVWAARNDDLLERSAQLIASMFELKQSARARSMSEFDLSRANVRYALALKAGQVATWSWDQDEQIIECDPLMRQLLGLQDVGTVTGSRLFRQIDPDDLTRIKYEVSTMVASDEDVSVEFRARSTGRYVLALGHVFERDNEGKPKKILGVAIDLTESKRSEDKTRLLLREVNHRVKNMLAILQSLASQTLRHSQSPERFTRAFSGRLAALATSHGLLSDQEWEDIDLVSLIQTQVKPYASHYAEQVTIEAEPIAINADAAIALGLVIHELATNAMQYGALSQRVGRLEISITASPAIHGQKMLSILWKETGGPALSEERRKGFGSILIEHSLNKIIGSNVHIDYEKSGIIAKIDMPTQ